MLLFFTGLLTFLKTTFFMVGYISNNSLFPEPLTAEEEKIYLDRLSKGDKEARNILIEKNLRLVNIEFLKRVFETLEIKNKINLPKYEEFILNNQSQKLKKVLKENNLNYKQFSKTINVDYSNVKKWLKGQAIMTKTSYNKIRNVYEI